MKRKLKCHYEHIDRPLCDTKIEGALLVEFRRCVTCERCKRALARRVAEAARVVLQ